MAPNTPKMPRNHPKMPFFDPRVNPYLSKSGLASHRLNPWARQMIIHAHQLKH